MAFPWGLLTFLIGMAYGLFTPGRENKGRLLRNGLIIGAILALVLALLGIATNLNPLGLANDAFGTFIAVAVLTVLFVLGAWIGDMIEGARGRTRQQV